MNDNDGNGPNDPKWCAFPGHDYQVARVAEGQAYAGIGGFHCNGCGEAHITLAIGNEQGFVHEVSLSPDMAAEYLKAGVNRLGDLGESFLALNALRAMTVVSQLASMTDTECDFLDGFGVREWCRVLLAGKVATYPRMYDSNDRLRAVTELHRYLNDPECKRHWDMGKAVDLVAEALGMKAAG